MMQASSDISSSAAVQLLAQAADALSLGDDVTRQVCGLGVGPHISEGLLPWSGILPHGRGWKETGDVAANNLLQLTSACLRQVRQYQNWSLMPFAAVIGNVYPATYVRGNRFGFGLYPGEWQSSSAQQVC